MTPLAALAALLGLLALTALLGLVAHRRSGRTQRFDQTDRLTAHDVGAARLGPGGTVVQFSTAYCSRCPGTRRLISELVTRYAGVDFVHVDVTDQPQLAARHRLLQTPTVLILDGGGAPRSRLAGTIGRESIATELNRIAGGSAHE